MWTVKFKKTPLKLLRYVGICKKEGHELEKCWKRKYVNSKKEQGTKGGTPENQNTGNGEESSKFSSTDLERCHKSVKALHSSAVLLNNSISFRIVQCIK